MTDTERKSLNMTESHMVTYAFADLCTSKPAHTNDICTIMDFTLCRDRLYPSFHGNVNGHFVHLC